MYISKADIEGVVQCIEYIQITIGHTQCYSKANVHQSMVNECSFIGTTVIFNIKMDIGVCVTIYSHCVDQK